MCSLTKAKQSLHHQSEQCARVSSENIQLEEEVNQLEESHGYDWLICNFSLQYCLFFNQAGDENKEIHGLEDLVLMIRKLSGYHIKQWDYELEISWDSAWGRRAQPRIEIEGESTNYFSINLLVVQNIIQVLFTDTSKFKDSAVILLTRVHCYDIHCLQQNIYSVA